jgi:cysteine desulfuration protein SufE
MRINDIQEKIIKEFSVLEDWLDKYEYIVRLGKELEPLDKTLKTESNMVKGCQASVWLGAVVKDEKMRFFADSDALITRGLIALLLRVLNHQTPEDVSNTDLYFIDKIGLSSHLSPGRANGLASIVKQMKWHGTRHLKPSR